MPELDQDMRFQVRQWTVQRVAWVIWLVILAAAAAGLLGSGPLSSAEAHSENGRVRVQYDRFEHANCDQRMLIRVAGPRSPGPLRLTMEQDFIDTLRLDRIEPPPRSSYLGPGRLIYEWDDIQAEAGERSIALYYRRQSAGKSLARVRVEGAGEVLFWQFVYP